MKYNLEFIQVSGPTHKTNFLQHIHELVHVKVEKGSTYRALFNGLKEKFKDEPDKLEVVEDWIHFNEEIPVDFDMEIVTEDENMYAIFDLIPVKS